MYRKINGYTKIFYGFHQNSISRHQEDQQHLDRATADTKPLVIYTWLSVVKTELVDTRQLAFKNL